MFIDVTGETPTTFTFFYLYVGEKNQTGLLII